VSERSGRTLILDTNLLVLLIVGMTSRAYISRHKRLRAYSESDFEVFTGFVVSATRIVVTPNTLTETSNLLRQIDEPARTQIYDQFRRVVRTTDEHYLESKRAAERKDFPWLGLTDSALLQAASENHELLTADSRLHSAAIRQGLKVTNFHHHRFPDGRV
jgi:predicted nucleic acid-binding protein